MCLNFFEGKGYSETFTVHMQLIKELLTANPQICLTVNTDEICIACPNNLNGICKSAEKVEKYDRAVLECCGLEEGQQISFSDFSELVKHNILEKDKREIICGDCSWSDICVIKKDNNRVQ
jgi:hypothetical protein